MPPIILTLIACLMTCRGTMAGHHLIINTPWLGTALCWRPPSTQIGGALRAGGPERHREEHICPTHPESSASEPSGRRGRTQPLWLKWAHTHAGHRRCRRSTAPLADATVATRCRRSLATQTPPLLAAGARHRRRRRHRPLALASDHHVPGCLAPGSASHPRRAAPAPS